MGHPTHPRTGYLRPGRTEALKTKLLHPVSQQLFELRSALRLIGVS